MKIHYLIFAASEAPHKRNMVVPSVKMRHNNNNFHPGLNQTLSIIASLEVKSARPSFTSVYIKGCRAAHVGGTIQDQLIQAGSVVSGENPFTHRRAAHINTESFLRSETRWWRCVDVSQKLQTLFLIKKLKLVSQRVVSLVLVAHQPVRVTTGNVVYRNDTQPFSWSDRNV